MGSALVCRFLTRDWANWKSVVHSLSALTHSAFAAFLSAIPLAFVSPWIAGGIYVAVALIWLVPDRRIEKVLRKTEPPGQPTDAASGRRT